MGYLAWDMLWSKLGQVNILRMERTVAVVEGLSSVSHPASARSTAPENALHRSTVRPKSTTLVEKKCCQHWSKTCALRGLVCRKSPWIISQKINNGWQHNLIRII